MQNIITKAAKKLYDKKYFWQLVQQLSNCLLKTKILNENKENHLKIIKFGDLIEIEQFTINKNISKGKSLSLLKRTKIIKQINKQSNKKKEAQFHQVNIKMSVHKQYDQKRFIGGDSKKHQNGHSNNLSQNSDEQRWHSVQESHNSKKKNHQFEHQLSQSGVQNSGTTLSKSHQHTGSLIGEIIPQQATDQAKKEKRNKDRLSHLSKLLPQKARWIGYLDVGCGNAEISVTIAQNLGIGSVYGVDMFDEDDFVQPSMDLEVKYLQNLNNKLNLPNNCVDLVTCFMAIHHFEHLDLMLREIQRVLLIEGYLFIREHDVPFKNKKLRAYIEEQHRKYPDHPADGYMMLYDREELKDILFAYGFEHLGDSNYTGQNLQAVYHSLYVLKRKEVNSNFKQLINKNRKDLKNNDSLNEEQEEDSQEKSSSNNFSSRESINSQGQQEGDDVLYFNQLSLSNEKRKSSHEFNRKEMQEQYEQIVLQQNSDSVSSEQDKEQSPVVVLAQNKQQQQQKTQLNQTHFIQEEKISTQERKNIQNQKKVNLYPDWDINSEIQNSKIEEEDVDVYANIISVPPSKKEQGSQSLQKQQSSQNKQLQQLKKSQNSNEKIQNVAATQILEEPSHQINENQKINTFDEDGFVVVGAKEKTKKQQPKNSIQASQQVTNIKGLNQQQQIQECQNSKKLNSEESEENLKKEHIKKITEKSIIEEHQEQQIDGEQETAVQDDERHISEKLTKKIIKENKKHEQDQRNSQNEGKERQKQQVKVDTNKTLQKSTKKIETNIQERFSLKQISIIIGVLVFAICFNQLFQLI
ncbi:UbiE/COQ5 family methyltransferase (macronuclear) [Tetrahymena thermophila SB210]|uniref:UbiE/COQ5 family methyltransferase n=1 Tax=Tetrahymena thermophila (strain SB210) TaxID=312017 RepID=I7MI07_TETTS|nr:UbiE/COQ5 family methyltransferase [Tetrahymena thermophila SB210]EAS03796.2 UbiE/COQ5 family methyltransferase [Tetrahymena thermophila SB210]|eukprot:XP_001024041.2 UbiE/COQ5 family methyltransferase [Tetrahymena thermophila SB210]